MNYRSSELFYREENRMFNGNCVSTRSLLIVVTFFLLAIWCVELFGPKPVPQLKAETNEVTTDDLMEYVEQCRFDIPEGAEIVGVEIVYFSHHQKAPLHAEREGRPVPLGIPTYYVKNIEIGESCAKDYVQKSSARGPGTLTSVFHEAIAARWDSDTKIRASHISKALGFDVTKTYELSTVHAVHFPEDKMYEAAAFPVYTLYKFDVYYSPLFGKDDHVGTGQAEIPSGVCFVWYQM